MPDFRAEQTAKLKEVKRRQIAEKEIRRSTEIGKIETLMEDPKSRLVKQYYDTGELKSVSIYTGKEYMSRGHLSRDPYQEYPTAGIDYRKDKTVKQISYVSKYQHGSWGKERIYTSKLIKHDIKGRPISEVGYGSYTFTAHGREKVRPTSTKLYRYEDDKVYVKTSTQDWTERYEAKLKGSEAREAEKKIKEKYEYIGKSSTGTPILKDKKTGKTTATYYYPETYLPVDKTTITKKESYIQAVPSYVTEETFPYAGTTFESFIPSVQKDIITREQSMAELQKFVEPALFETPSGYVSSGFYKKAIGDKESAFAILEPTNWKQYEKEVGFINIKTKFETIGREKKAKFDYMYDVSLKSQLPELEEIKFKYESLIPTSELQAEKLEEA